MKFFKKYYWIFTIVILAFLGMGSGLLYLYSANADNVLENISVGDLTLSGVTLEQAQGLISEYYEQAIKNGAQKIEIDGHISEIAYADIDVMLDIDKIMETLKSHVSSKGLKLLFTKPGEANRINPVFTYNSGKLISKLEGLFGSYEKEPVSEEYEIRDGNLVLIPQVPGINVDYEAMEKEIGSMLLLTQEPFSVSTNNSPFLVEIRADKLYEETFTAIISKSSVGFEPGLSGMALSTAESVNRVVIENDGEFSLKELIDFSLYDDDVEKDLLNRTASAIYQSLLPIEGIKTLNRRPAAIPVSYTEPGLEAVIEGEGADLALKNGTGKPLMVFAEAAHKTLHIYVASAGEIETGSLVVEKKDQVPPPVITRVNPSLGADETRVVSEGVPGFTAHVSRVIDGRKQAISSDRYNPISKVVERGEKQAGVSDK